MKEILLRRGADPAKVDDAVNSFYRGNWDALDELKSGLSNSTPGTTESSPGSASDFAESAANAAASQVGGSVNDFAQGAANEAAQQAGSTVSDFSNPNLGNDATRGGAASGPANVNAFRPNNTAGAAASIVDEDAFNRGMNTLDAKESFRIDGDYPEAARLVKALNQYRHSLAEAKRLEAEYRRYHQQMAAERRRQYAYQVALARQQANELQRYYAAQQQAYNNWLAQQHRAAAQYGQDAGHRSGGVINDPAQR